MKYSKKTKRLILVLVVVLTGCFPACAQQLQKESAIHNTIQKLTDDIFDDLVAIRRDFHIHPEVSEQEERTSEKIAGYLRSLGLEVKTNIGGYGVVGILNGSKAGKRIAWRADIDAMPSNIPDVVDFVSVNEGVRHICGHDVHAAVGLGIANVLAQQKENLEGTVYFIFQPAEENYKGAKAMIDEGLLDEFKIDEIYGLHISPFPVGTVATKAGNVYAHTNHVEVAFKPGREEAKIDYTKRLISGFQNVDPNSRFWELESLGDPEIGIESPTTIFANFFTVKENFRIKQTKDQLVITATLNSASKEQLDSFLDSLKQKMNKSEFSRDLDSIHFSYEKAVVINDEELTSQTAGSISNIYGKESFIPLYGQITADRGDDFAYFQKTIPGVYYFLGGANYETGVISMPHSPNFAVDEESIRFGVKYFSSMMVEQMSNQ